MEHDQFETVNRTEVSRAVDAVVLAFASLIGLALLKSYFLDDQFVQYVDTRFLAFHVSCRTVVVTTVCLLLLPTFCFRLDPKIHDLWMVVAVVIFTATILLLYGIGRIDRNYGLLPPMLLGQSAQLLACLLLPGVVAAVFALRNWESTMLIRRRVGYVIIVIHVLACILLVSAVAGLRRLIGNGF